jgi:hypothetical protein
MRLKVAGCAALSVSMLTGLDRMHADHEQEIRGTVAGLPIHLRLKLVRGSHGWLFVCPQCQRTARVLHFPPESAEPGCRVCLKLLYESQSWTRDMRITRAWFAYDRWQAEQYAFCGSEQNCNEIDP